MYLMIKNEGFKNYKINELNKLFIEFGVIVQKWSGVFKKFISVLLGLWYCKEIWI